MELHERLERWDGKDVAFLEEVFDLHSHREDFARDALAELTAPARFQTAATWLLKRAFEEGDRLAAADSARFLRALPKLEPWEARLHALQSLPYLRVTAKTRSVVERFVREALTSDVKFVRAWAFTGLHELAKAFPELRPEAERLFQDALEEGPASVRARVRHLVKAGF